MTPQELLATWRQRALALQVYAPLVAKAFEAAADELEAAVRAADDELLTVPQAAAISGYSADHLGRLVRSGQIHNHGRRGAPRLRRGDLPRRPERTFAGRCPNVYDVDADARSLASRRKELAT